MIKAIETRYAGHKFRSRLEARWAVFFSAMGVRWLYEPEGFETPEGRYLPDFFLPDIRGGLWVEVKPPFSADAAAKGKLESVLEQTLKEGVIVTEIPSWEATRYFLSGWQIQGHSEHGPWSDNPYVFCICPYCRKVGFECDGRGARVCAGRCGEGPIKDPENFGLDHGDRSYSGHHPVLLNAYDAARTARFEFGETPA